MRRITMITAMMATTLAGCSTLPNAPEAVRAPEGQKLALGVFASGVQIYECAAADNGARYEWKFKAPDATLLDFGGRPMGTHYAGPTWKAPDGSTVVGSSSRCPVTVSFEMCTSTSPTTSVPVTRSPGCCPFITP